MGEFTNSEQGSGVGAGLFGWIFFNILGMVTPSDVLQMFSFGAAGLSALAVGVYHVAKTIKLLRDGDDDKNEEHTE